MKSLRFNKPVLNIIILVQNYPNQKHVIILLIFIINLDQVSEAFTKFDSSGDDKYAFSSLVLFMGFNDRMAFNFTQMDFCHFRCSMHIQQFVNISSTNSFFFYQAGLPRVLCDDPQQEGSPKMIPRKNAQKTQKLFLEKMPKTPKNYSCFSKFMLDSFTSREEATPRMG